MSRQKAAGSWGDTTLTALKRYVGGGACYHQFPRMSLLGSSLNRGSYLQTVAYTPNGVDILVAAFRLQGCSQPLDMHVYGARPAYPRVVPHLFGQFLPALQLARLRG